MDRPFDFEDFEKDLYQPTGNFTVKIGDCYETIKTMAEEGVTFDAFVSDPPYGITLHGREEKDSGELVFSSEYWSAVNSILKPGAFLVAFAASRHYHKVASAIEDAGFIIYPMLQWKFPGGLPKPANLSELFDRDNVKDRKVVGTKSGSGFTTENERQGAQQRLTTQFAVKERGVSEEAKQWDGFYYGVNTMLPAIEPIVLAQKPISEKRMIDNVRKHGVGALNVGRLREQSGSWPSSVFEYRKSSKKDHGSTHPSVKPIDLMQGLCELVCPPGGHIIDPFAGTGTTGAAAVRAGFDCTLIEQDEEMRAVIESRITQPR